jgi:hypothetical protein
MKQFIRITKQLGLRLFLVAGLLAGLLAAAGSAPAYAAPTSITLISGGGSGGIGTLDPAITYSNSSGDSGSAVIMTPSFFYATIPGTRWVNTSGTLNFDQGSSQATTYTAHFTLPAGFVSAAITVQVLADNEAIVSLNGTEIGRQPHFVYSGPELVNFQTISTFSWSTSSDFMVGENTLSIANIDYDSTNGVNFKAVITYDTAPCSPGTYNNGTECVDADPGYYVPVSGATEQTPCAPGTYQPNASSVSCIPTDAGHYVDVSGAVMQIDCLPGSYQPNSGATSCILAEAGHYVDVTAAAMQIDCLPGTYQPDSGATSCILASPGHYVDVSGAVMQIDCLPGSYQPNSGATSCILASAGYYVPVSAAIEQIACPAGYTSEAGATECTLAPDTTAPTITLTTPVNGATYLLNQSILADYACQDEAGGSDLASCVGTVPDGSAIDTSSVGAKAFTVNAADNAGNPNSATVSYNVVYNFSGFSSPVDNAPTLNVAKAGQAIPLKWRIVDANGLPVTNLSSVSVTVASLSCSLGTTTDALEEYTSGDSGLQNLGDGYYQFNWKTPKTYANSCKTLKLNLGEGSGFEHTALFKFTK